MRIAEETVANALANELAVGGTSPARRGAKDLGHADQKVLSIFEPHTDLIVTGKRDPLYGHKVCLTTGKSGLLIDCQVLDGNPNDTTLAVDAIERVEQIYGQPPRQAAFDAGFRSTANLHKIKDLGVEDVVFNKGG
ncbi:MAG: transposase, partial [Proteobacteria bacterium]|nr:transposase [Pseudomonadota bacterium]